MVTLDLIHEYHRVFYQELVRQVTIFWDIYWDKSLTLTVRKYMPFSFCIFEQSFNPDNKSQAFEENLELTEKNKKPNIISLSRNNLC